MLPRDHRLRPRSQVRATIRHGRRVRAGSIVVHYSAGDDGVRAAVVVNRAHGGSVQRHHRQRQVRHALAAMWDGLPPGSYVVRALPGTASHDALRTDLARAVSRL